jgi:formylglycine-generating enzyme required for sulfatase activity
LPEYQIGKYPVTNAEYKDFVEAGGYNNNRWWTEAGWAQKVNFNWTKPGHWDDVHLKKPNQPVVEVSWYECMAYCRWFSAKNGHSYRLPTEAEWEKAARGSDGRKYPWGDFFEYSRLNSSEGEQTVKTTTPVGIYPTGANSYDCLDMAGNVWEWTGSLWGKRSGEPDYIYPYDHTDGRENLEASDNVFRVLRGGSWSDVGHGARCACRTRDNPKVWCVNVGFRIVGSPISAL